jgi:micrococcal nuclease
MRLASLAVAALTSSLSACGGEGPCGATEATVTRVVDGDTIELDDGRKIRLLLVDTPETTSGKNECYGSNAVTFTSDLVLDKTVQLSFDVECTDRFGRTLAYVTVDGQEINTLIIQRGFGCVLHISPDGDSRVDEFKGYQVEAKSANRGLWGACDPLPPACT